MARDPYTYFRIEARELLEGLAKGVLSLESKDLGKDLVAGMLRMAHTLKGAARVVKQSEISDLAHRMEGILVPFRDAEGRLPKEASQQLLDLIDRSGAFVTKLGNPSETQPKSADQNPVEEPTESVRIEISQLDALLRDIAEAQVHLETLRKEVPLLEQLRRQARSFAQRARSIADACRGNLAPAGTPLATLGSSAAELQSASARVAGSLGATVERLERDLGSARDRAGELRLLPANTVFAALARSVRDVGEALQKHIQFDMSGGEQRLDAHVLTGLRDALIHAVRNAAAHGIETPEQRLAVGKPAEGQVRLHVERNGQQILFRVEDDGRGLDLEAIRTAAVSRGLISRDAAVSMSVEELSRLLFHGGLSTTTTASQFSGRGVGLDIVRAAVARLNGDVSLRTRPGHGTTLEMSVPMSIESMTVLAVGIGQSVVLLPFRAVRQLVRASDGVTLAADGSALITGDQAITFRSLGRLLRSTDSNGAPQRKFSAVIIQAGGARVALGVDRLLGIRNVVVRRLPALCGPVPLVVGAALNGTGNPELVLDPPGLVAAALHSDAPPALPAPPRQPTVLVVDDSMTTRMLEQTVLEAAGFEVELASSGEEALQKARQRLYSLFLVDVEMPGMNGFELLERFQGDSQLQRTPAVMVTSRSSVEDRLCAERVGARDYIVKSEFDESRLLRIVQELIDEAGR